MRLDLDFFDDPSVQLLYEDNPSDVADAAVVLFIRMVIRAHRLDRADVLEEFQRSKSERRHATLAVLADAGLIDDKGIKPTSFGMWRTPDSGWYDSDRGRAGGLARATSAERDDAGRFASVDQRETTVDQRGEPGAGRGGAGRGGNGAVEESVPSAREIQMDGLPSTTPEAVKELQDRTGTTWSQFGQRQLGEYDRLIGQHGLPAVLEAIDKVRSGKILTARQVIWPAMKILEPFAEVDQKEATAKEQAAQADSNARKLAEQTQMSLHYSHIDGAENHPLCPACRGEVVS